MSSDADSEGSRDSAVTSLTTNDEVPDLDSDPELDLVMPLTPPEITVLRHICRDADADPETMRLDFSSLMEEFEDYCSNGQVENLELMREVLISLPQYGQPSWSANLDLFVDRLSRAQELARVQRLAQAFDQWTERRLRLHLHQWHRVLRKTRSANQAMMRAALHQDAAQLVVQSFNSLRAVYHRRQGLFEHAEIVDARSTKLRALVRWRQQFRDLQTRHETASVIEQHALIRRAWNEWQSEARASHQTQVYNNVVAKGALDLWRSALSEANDLEAQADEIHSATLQFRVLRIWRIRHGTAEFEWQRAQDHYDTALAANMVAYWTKSAKLAHIGDNLLEKHRRTQLHTLICDWHTRGLQAKEARAFAVDTCGRKFLALWWRRLQLSWLEQARDRQLAQRALGVWMAASRMRLLERLHNTDKAARVLSIWRARLRNVQDLDRRAVVYQEGDLLPVRPILEVWRHKLAQLSEDSELAVLFHERSLKVRGLATMVLALDNHRDVSQRAEALAGRSMKHDFVRFWRDAAQRHKEIRLAADLQEYLLQRQTDKARARLHQWLRRLDAVEHQSERAIQSDDETLATLFANHLRLWQRKTKKLTENTATADSKAQTNTKSKIVAHWKQEAFRIRSLDQDAAIILQVSSDRALSGALRTWKKRFYQVQARVREADDFVTRRRAAMPKQLLRLWKYKARGTVQEMPQTPTPAARALDRSLRTTVARLRAQDRLSATPFSPIRSRAPWTARREAA